MITRSRILRLLIFLMLLALSACFWVGIVPPQPRAIFEPFSDTDFVAFTPDSEILVTRQPRWVWPTGVRPWQQTPPGSLMGGEERPGRIQVWNVREGTLLQSLDGDWAKAEGVIPAPDSQRLIGWINGEADESPHVLLTCDLRSGEVIDRLTYPYSYFSDTQLVISPDGQWLAITLLPGVGPFYLWRIGSNRLSCFDGAYEQITFSKDGELLAATSSLTATDQEDGECNVVVWRLVDLTRPWRKQRWPAQGGRVLPGCGTVATFHWSKGQVKLWEMASGGLLATFPFREVSDHDLVTAAPAYQILESRWLWDLSGQPRFMTFVHENDSISPDGQWLLRSEEPGVRLLGLRSGKSLSLTHGADQQSNQGPLGRFSPDSRRVIVTEIGQRDVGPVGFWQWLRSFFIHAPAQDWLWMARLWDVETGKQVAAFDGCTKALFSPDGQTLATLHEDGSVRLWDTSFPPPIWRILGTAVGLWVLLFVIGKAWRRH